VPILNTASGCGWTGLAPRAVQGPNNNTITKQCKPRGGGPPPPPGPGPPAPLPSSFNTTTTFHPLTAAGDTGDASGVIQTADGRWHIFPDCHPTADQAKHNKSFSPPGGYDGMGWAHLSSDDLVHWIDHGMAMQPGRVHTGGYVPFDEDYDNMLMDTGSMSTLPNGSVFAIISGINKSSLPSTYDGNIIGALAQNPQLLSFKKFGTMIPNPTDPNRPIRNNATDTPAPGQLPRYSFRDPTTPWLDECVPGGGPRGARCWFVLIGSGNFTHNNALLYRSVSDTDIETHWTFEKVLWASSTNQVFDHACPGYFCIYSCPDFFRLSGSLWFFGSLDQEYWLGSYENHTFTPNAFYDDGPGMMLDSTIWKTGAKAGWWDRSKPAGRRIMWGGYHSMMTMPRELGVGASGELTMRFVDELSALRQSVSTTPESTFGRHLELTATFAADCVAFGPTGYGLVVLNTTTVSWNGTYLIVNGPEVTNGVNGGHYSPLTLRHGEALSLHVFVDGGIIEVIANNRTLVTAFVRPPSDEFEHTGLVGCNSPLQKYQAYALTDLGPAHELHQLSKETIQLDLPRVYTKTDDNEGIIAEELLIGVNLSSLTPMNMMWQQCIGSGHAALWSRADWREHLAMVSHEIGFRYIRGHGILDNSVMFYDACPNDGKHEHTNPAGQPGDTASCIPDKSESTGSYWDAFSAYDYMLSVGSKPIVELSFTPNPLVEQWEPGMPNPSECDHFHYDSCELPPTNLTRYSELIGKFAGALLERYGQAELRHWKFEVYNEADLHWTFPQYASMYHAAAMALKSVDPGLHVGGPASAQPAWVGLLIDYCKNTTTPLDFVSTHAYPVETSSLESQMAQLRVAQRLADTDGGKPLLITEWSSGGTGWVTLPDGVTKAPPMHDSWRMGAWIIAAVLNATDTPGINLAVYSYWALSDVFTEQGLPQNNISFSGNWGLVNIFGVRKPSFRAFQMLRKAGSTRAALALGHTSNEDLHAVALLDGKDLQSSTAVTILLANHACAHHCPEPRPMRLNISIRGAASFSSSGARPGRLSATVHRINATSGNPKVVWEKQGAPNYPSPWQMEEIHAASRVLNSTVDVIWRGDGTVEVVGVYVEAYSLVAVQVELPHVVSRDNSLVKTDDGFDAAVDDTETAEGWKVLINNSYPPTTGPWPSVNLGPTNPIAECFHHCASLTGCRFFWVYTAGSDPGHPGRCSPKISAQLNASGIKPLHGNGSFCAMTGVPPPPPPPTPAPDIGRFVATQGTFGHGGLGAYGLAAFTAPNQPDVQFLAVANFFGNTSSIWRWNIRDAGSNFSLFQTIPSRAGHAWRHFTIGQDDYLALANYRSWPASGPCIESSTVGGGEDEGVGGCPPITEQNSTIWKWTGVNFIEHQQMITFGANAWEHFTIDREDYLVVANSHRNVSNAADQGDVKSVVFRWSATKSSFVQAQTILTHMALDVKQFTIGGVHYLAFANSPCFRPAALHLSPIYVWNGTAFALFQTIPTSGATGWEHFTIGDSHFLVVANRLCPSTGHLCKSEILHWNGSRFVHNQTIATNGAYDWESFEIEKAHYLVVANNADTSTAQPGVGESAVFTWDNKAFKFVPYQIIPTNGAEQWRHFVAKGEHYLAVAQMATGTNTSQIFRWHPSRATPLKSDDVPTSRSPPPGPAAEDVVEIFLTNFASAGRHSAGFIYEQDAWAEMDGGSGVWEGLTVWMGELYSMLFAAAAAGDAELVGLRVDNAILTAHRMLRSPLGGAVKTVLLLANFALDNWSSMVPASNGTVLLDLCKGVALSGWSVCVQPGTVAVVGDAAVTASKMEDDENPATIQLAPPGFADLLIKANDPRGHMLHPPDATQLTRPNQTLLGQGVESGLGRFAALYARLSTLRQTGETHSDNRCLYIH
jgi:xylan 1,4-beta-xylosidase